MKKVILIFLREIALCSAIMSLSQCSLWGGHQPVLSDSLKISIDHKKEEICERL